MNINNTFLLLIATLALFLSSCSDPRIEENEIKEVSFYLTDCPYDADEVNVEILQVSVEDNDGNIIDLNTNVGVFNLLDFQNDIDTLLASGNVNFEDIKQLIVELGEDNTIVIDGETFPLELLKQGDNIVKIKLNVNKLDNASQFLIDFYACTSIIEKSNGFFLKPVIKFKGEKGNNSGGTDFDSVEDFFENIKDCYDLVFPIELLDSASNIVLVNSEEELSNELASNTISSIVFPIEIIDILEQIIVLQNEMDVIDLEKCNKGPMSIEFQEKFENILSCYGFVYPVSFYDSVQMEIIVNDSLEAANAFIDGLISDFKYPFKIFKQNGNEFEIKKENMLNSIKDCDSFNDNTVEDLIEELQDCYTIVYPIQFIEDDGSTATANNLNQLNNLLDDEKLAEFVFPINVKDADDNTIIIDDVDELETLLDEC